MVRSGYLYEYFKNNPNLFSSLGFNYNELSKTGPPLLQFTFLFEIYQVFPLSLFP